MQALIEPDQEDSLEAPKTLTEQRTQLLDDV